MAEPITAVFKFVSSVFAGTAVSGAGAFAAAANTLLQVGAFTALDAGIRAVTRRDRSAQRRALGSRDFSYRSGNAYKTIIYGQARVGGVIDYVQTAGASNEYLYRMEILAGHECEDITEVWLDDERIDNSHIDWAGDGDVTAGTFYIDGVAYVRLWKRLGASGQVANSEFVSTFTDITSSHRQQGHCMLDVRMWWVEGSDSVWSQKGPPNHIKALVRGKNDIYDPRLDSSPGNDPSNASYQAYTDNPILCVANYMTDSRLGMGIDAAKIDWQVVSDEADYCDVLSPVPTASSEKRFTCNGSLTTGQTFKENLAALLSSCNGRVAYSNGKFKIRCARFGGGANLCTNPTFDSGITGWSAGNGAGSIAHNATDDTIEITNGSGGLQSAYFALTTVVGNTYTARVVTKAADANLAEGYGLRANNNSGDLTGPLDSVTTTEENAELRITFTATATTTYIHLFITNTTSGDKAEFDDVEMYLVSTQSIDGDWFTGDLTYQAGPTEKNGRFNEVHPMYVSEEQAYKSVEGLVVKSANMLSRDNGEPLPIDVDLPFTNTETQAQRLAHKLLNAGHKKTYGMPLNYRALNIAVHDQVTVTLADAALSNSHMRVRDYELSDLGNSFGVQIGAVEDDADTYADPNASEYSARTAAGTIVWGLSDVPDPTGFSVTAKEGGILVEWVNPTLSNTFDVVQVWHSATDDRTVATVVYAGRLTSFFHKLDNGETGYYWIRAKKDDLLSDYVPNTTTSIYTATASNRIALAENRLPDARWSLGHQGGNENDPRNIQDQWNADGDTKLIDADTGQVQTGLTQTDGVTSLDDVTINTTDLFSNEYSMSGDQSSGSWINVWELDRDGSSPVSLLSNLQDFEFTEAGVFLITVSLTASMNVTLGDTSATRVFMHITPYLADPGSSTFTAMSLKMREEFFRPSQATGTSGLQPSFETTFPVNASVGTQLRFSVATQNLSSWNIVASESKLMIEQQKQHPDP